jgi:hypothetical protein
VRRNEHLVVARIDDLRGLDRVPVEGLYPRRHPPNRRLSTIGARVRKFGTGNKPEVVGEICPGADVSTGERLVHRPTISTFSCDIIYAVSVDPFSGRPAPAGGSITDRLRTGTQ